MPNLRALANKLQTALAQKERYIKINQFQSWSDRKKRMVTKFVVCEKHLVEINIEKLKARYPDGFDAEKSMHRQEGDL